MKRKVIFFVGSTASGKSSWAIDFAQQNDCAIINCDSIQVYQDLFIGSASPTMEEKRAAPHHLYNYVSYPEEMSLGRYHRDFFKVLETLPLSQNVLVVGGSGFYFRALEKGLLKIPEIPVEIRQQVLHELEIEGGQLALYRELCDHDPESGEKIHAQDSYRIARAVEVIRAHGKSPRRFEMEHNSENSQLEIMKVGISYSKAELLPRVIERTNKMLRKGLIEEVRPFYEKGLTEWAPMKAIGYREVVQHLQGEISFADLPDAIVMNTMKLIKKQRTWFQKEAGLHWFLPDDREHWLKRGRKFFAD